MPMTTATNATLVTWTHRPIYEATIICTERAGTPFDRCPNRSSFVAFAGVRIIDAKCSEHARTVFNYELNHDQQP